MMPNNIQLSLYIDDYPILSLQKLHPATNEKGCRYPESNIRRILENSADEVEKGLLEPEGSRDHMKTQRIN